jgi:hypothetical protein
MLPDGFYLTREIDNALLPDTFPFYPYLEASQRAKWQRSEIRSPTEKALTSANAKGDGGIPPPLFFEDHFCRN